MGGSLTVRQARLVLPDRVVTGDLVVEDGVITEIAPRVDRTVGEALDGRGLVVLPGAIDSHVLLESIEDLSAASGSALAGGVTTLIALRGARTCAELKFELARAQEISKVHFGLYVGATADNHEELVAADRAQGAYVSGDLLHGPAADLWFSAPGRMLVVDHVDPARLLARAQLYANGPELIDHAKVHDVDSAVAATKRALELAHKYGRPTHLLHPSTAEEVELLRDRAHPVSAAARLTHLFLDDEDLLRLGPRGLTDPPIRGGRHRQALWEGLRAGVIELVSGGHAAVKAADKDRPYDTAPRGQPTLEFTMALWADAAATGRCGLPDIARWTSDGPARMFRIPRKGRLEIGFDGDLVVLDPSAVRTVGVDAPIRTPGGWSPWEGRALTGWPVITVVSGHVAFRDGRVSHEVRGRPL